MLCYVMSCYVMLCYVMICYVMLCYVMLCYVGSYRVARHADKNIKKKKKEGLGQNRKLLEKIKSRNSEALNDQASERKRNENL